MPSFATAACWKARCGSSASTSGCCRSGGARKGKTMHGSEEYIPGEVFHSSVRKVYSGPLGWAVNKQAGLMARVLYERVHENRQYDDERRGAGLDRARWI